MDTASDNDNKECNSDSDPHRKTSRDIVDIPFRLPLRLFGDINNNTRIFRLKCIDCHAGGEPARVVLSGIPSPPANCTTALLKRSYMMDRFDHLRKILLLEPRGYPCQNVNFVFPPSLYRNNNDNDSDNISSGNSGGTDSWQYVIGEQQKIYPLMSGHNTICVATALLECGVIPIEEPLTDFFLEAPAGPIEIRAKCEGGKAISIAFTNAPSFVEHLDVPVVLPNRSGFVNVKVNVDVAYGGMWYCIVDLQQFRTAGPQLFLSKLKLDPSCGKELCRIGEMIKVACREQYPVQHPTEDYPGCDILAFRDSGNTKNKNNINAVIMSNNVLDWDRPETWTAMIDRSPCGTGTCAIMATLHARGMLKVGDIFDHYSIVGSKFTGTILAETTLTNGKIAILPRIEGSACITQYSEVVVDGDYDPFPEGYKVADIW